MKGAPWIQGPVGQVFTSCARSPASFPSRKAGLHECIFFWPQSRSRVNHTHKACRRSSAESGPQSPLPSPSSTHRPTSNKNTCLCGHAPGLAILNFCKASLQTVARGVDVDVSGVRRNTWTDVTTVHEPRTGSRRLQNAGSAAVKYGRYNTASLAHVPHVVTYCSTSIAKRASSEEIKCFLHSLTHNKMSRKSSQRVPVICIDSGHFYDGCAQQPLSEPDRETTSMNTQKSTEIAPMQSKKYKDFNSPGVNFACDRLRGRWSKERLRAYCPPRKQSAFQPSGAYVFVFGFVHVKFFEGAVGVPRADWS